MDSVTLSTLNNPITGFERQEAPINASLERYLSDINPINQKNMKGDGESEKESQSQDKPYNTLEAPAYELSLSTRLQDEIRSVAMFTRNYLLTTGNTDDSSKSINDMVKRCAALKAKASSKSLSEGQKTYIQSEIDQIKRKVSGLDIAM